MNINDYNTHIRLADTTSSNVELPSEYNIIKNPPTKMRVASSAPVVNRYLLREQKVFLAWAYKEYFSVRGEVTFYHFFGNSGESGVSSKYSFPRNSVALENYSREIVSYTTMSESSYRNWNSIYTLRSFRKVYITPPSVNLRLASQDELIETFGDYTTRTITNKGDPIRLDRTLQLLRLVTMAKSCLNGGFGEYIYYSDYPDSFTDAPSISASEYRLDGGFSLKKDFDIDFEPLVISPDARIYQLPDESVDVIDYTSTIVNANFATSNSHVSGFDVFLIIRCEYDSKNSLVSGGVSGSKMIVLGPFSFSGNKCTISLSSLGITSGEALLKLLKAETGFEFLTVDATTLQGLEEWNVTGSAQYGIIRTAAMHVSLLPKINYGIE